MKRIGVILAGGAGRRLGAPKHTLRFHDGTTVLQHLTNILHDVCTTVVVSGPSPLLPALEYVPDVIHNCGPLGGLHAVCAHWPDSEIVVVPTDMPLLTAPMLRRLAHASPDDVVAFRVEHGGPFPLRIAGRLGDHLARQLRADERRLLTVLDTLSVTWLDADEQERTALINVNTPDDALRAGVSFGDTPA